MSTNVEHAVLGACLCSASCYWRVADLLTPEDFSDGRLAKLYALIRERARAESAFDAVTIGDVAPQLSNLALELATGEGWRQGNIRAYAELVASNAVMRRVKQAGQQIAHLDGPDALGQAQRLIAGCSPRQIGAIRHVREFLRESVTEMQRRVDASEELTGIPTSLPTLDKLLCGWQPTDLIVIAARPSVGKTAFALQSAGAAARAGKHVLFFSLEMSGVQLTDRLQAHFAEVNASGIRRPKLFNDADFRRLFEAEAEIAQLPMDIDDTAGLTVEAIGARARQAHAANQLDLIVIDYLTQITPPKANTTAEALQIVTRALKGLAKELSVPVILLSQLNREGEGHRPTLKTLRDSGAIEQDADVVIFLHRPDPSKREQVIAILEKQRNGETGDIHLNAKMEHMRFAEIEAAAESSSNVQPGFAGYPRRSRSNESGRWNGY